MDQQLLQLINQTWTSPAMDRAMAIVTDSSVGLPVLVVAGVLALLLGGFRERAFLLALGLSIGVTDGLVVNSTKDVVQRPRPHEVVAGVRTVELAPARLRMMSVIAPLEVRVSPERIRPPGGRSFPSGHAANMFALATVIAVFYRPWGAMAYLPAAAVAYSRVYVGVHWPTDVVISALQGIGLSLCVIAVCEWGWRKISHRVPGWVSCGRGSLLLP
jgi:undecaprenyl-diphosphatase